MLISKVIPTPEGDLQFDGEMSIAEYERVFDFGLLALYKAGMLPFATVKVADVASVLLTNRELH